MSAAPAPRRGALLGLVVSSLATAILAVIQWRELLHTLAGGTSFCAINEVLNCAYVWESDFAKAIHRITRVPIAGWGLAWGMAALASSGLFWVRQRKDRPLEIPHAAVLACAAAGVGSSVVLFLVSHRLGVFCVTCIGTYVLTLVFAGCALFVRPPRALSVSALARGSGMAAGFAGASYLLLLVPGLATPVERASQLGGGKDSLASFLQSLPAQVQQSVADAFEEYQRSPVPDVRRFAPGHMIGSSSAPVKLVEFFDIRCVHCKHFAEVLRKLESTLPEGALAIDLHLFPLDATCNPTVGKDMVDESGVRCAGARALLCLEAMGGFRSAEERLFEVQSSLTKDRVLQIVSETARVPRPDLEACMASKETEAKLKQDIDYAMAYDIEGTPLVVVNGRRATAIPPFLYALILAHGDVRSPGWQVLPRPQAGASR